MVKFSFDALGVTKLVVSTVVGVGAGRIVKQIIKKNVEAPEALLDKVVLLSGSWALGGIVSKATKAHTDEIVEEVFLGVGKAVKSIKTNSKLGRINSDKSTFEDEGLDQNDFEQDDDDKWVPKKEEDKPRTYTEDEIKVAVYEFITGKKDENIKSDVS